MPFDSFTLERPVGQCCEGMFVVYFENRTESINCPRGQNSGSWC